MDIVAFLKITECVGIAVLFAILIYTTLQRPSEMQKHIAVLSISCILMIAGYLVEVDSLSLDSAMMGAAMSCIGKPFIMLSSFLMVASFYGRKIPKRVFIPLCVYAGLFPVIVFTNRYHYLYFATTAFNFRAKYTPLILTHGKLYILNIINAVVYFPACIIEILAGYRRVKSKMRTRLSIYLILMVLSGLVGYALYILKLTNGYDSTILGVSIGSFFLVVLFFRCKVFDVADNSKDYALNVSTEGLIVYDDADSVVFQNRAAKKLTEKDIPLETISRMGDGENIFRKDNRTYSVNVNAIRKGSELLGKSVEVRDITDSYNYQLSLEKAINDTTEKLDIVRRTIFGSIASIVEARSIETGDHIRRVSTYAEQIAGELRKEGRFTDILTDEYVNILVLSAPLHDVGKISVSDSILLKPGKLTDDEFEQMKTHSETGAKIIRSTMQGLEDEEYISMAETIAMYHHERWDGTGYPCGLRGENIPLCARIIAIADCYDAMTSKRCYKEAFSDEEALAIIREARGTHFDPVIADAFLMACK